MKLIDPSCHHEVRIFSSLHLTAMKAVFYVYCPMCRKYRKIHYNRELKGKAKYQWADFEKEDYDATHTS